jgi:hypothetical protein
VADDSNKVIITRIQNRRGLKQDLPQPLRPGEIGFAIDSRQVFIGSDPGNDSESNDFNRQSVFEPTLNAKASTISIANNNIVFFTVPFKKYRRGEFSGITKTASWRPTDFTETGSTLTVFPANTLITTNAIVANTSVSLTVELTSINSNINVGDIARGVGIFAPVGSDVTVREIDPTANTVTLSENVSVVANTVITFIPNNLINVLTDTKFRASSITVSKNGVTLIGDDSDGNPAANKDYTFGANTSSANTHVINFRTAPLSSEEIAVCYYSNTAIIQALQGSDPLKEPWNPDRSNFSGEPAPLSSTLIAAYSSVQNFYTAYQIPKYRQIPAELVTVSKTTGTGFIGLQYKHLAVTADTGLITTPNNLTLGNLLVSRSDRAANVITYTSNSAITFGVDENHPYEVGANISYVYVQTFAGGYLNGKVFPVTAATAGVANIQVALPSNNFITARAVTATLLADSSFGSNSDVELSGNLEGVNNNMHVFILDETANSNINGQVYVVSNVVQGTSGNPGTMRINTGADQFNANVTSNISFVNYFNDPTGSTSVQVYSEKHGFSSGQSVHVRDSANIAQIANTSYTANNVTINTFVINPTAPVLEHITGNISPDLAEVITTTSITPVRSINLTSADSLTDVVASVNAVNDWPEFNLVPDATSLAYFTHKPGYSSVGLNFRLHEDSVNPTLSVLALTEKEYTRNDTVKAKLEQWLNTCLESYDVNIFSSVGIAELYNSNTTATRSLGDFILNIDNTFDEIEFRSREEARDFNKIVNRIYFERPNLSNDDIKGLVNLKTNIELQTKQGAIIGDKLVSYSDMNTAVIPAAGGVISGLTQSVDRYNTYLIDYSIKEASSVTLPGKNYQRVGTMFVSARPDFLSNSKVIFYDTSTEMIDVGLAGNLSFTASLVGNNIVFNATNSLGEDLEVKYLVKRWDQRGTIENV